MISIYETVSDRIKVVYEVETVPSQQDIVDVAKFEAYLDVMNKLDLYDEV